MNELEQILTDIDGGKVLDAATGDGEFVAVLVDNLRSFTSITGIDVDENLLADAHRQFSSRTIRFRHADAAALPFSDQSFDMVTMSNALHHVEEPGLVLAELCRVVKTGRPVLFQEMVADELSPAEQVIADLHEIKAAVDMLLGIPHRRTYSRAEIWNLLTDSGLELARAAEYREPIEDPFDPSGIDGRMEFIFSYLKHIAGSQTEYSRLTRDAFRIKERIYRTGIAMPPELVIVTHRRS